jgi:Family of unknown function (DUF5752)
MNMSYQLDRSETPSQTQQGTATFIVKDCALIELATGKRAFTLKELGDNLATITPDSIYHHFWGSLLEPRFEEREYNNDFAAWARRGLHDDILAERLAMVDPIINSDIESLRRELIEIIEDRLEENKYLHSILATESFEFVRSQIVVFDTNKRLLEPKELCSLVSHLSVSSIFFHFIDARTRLPQKIDDFRFWLSSNFDGKYDILCQKLGQIDPFFQSLTELRQQLGGICQNCYQEVEGCIL